MKTTTLKAEFVVKAGKCSENKYRALFKVEVKEGEVCECYKTLLNSIYSNECDTLALVCQFLRLKVVLFEIIPSK